MPTRINYGDRIARGARLRVSTSAVLFNSDRDQLILVRRSDNGLWSLPAGGMLGGESAAESCIREMLEETGLAVQVARLIGIYTSPNWLIEYASGDRAQAVAFCFEVDLLSGDLQAGEENSETGYFSAQEIEKMDLVASHRQRILDAFENQAEAFVR